MDLEEENKKLKEEIEELKAKLKKYTNHPSKYEYYVKNKEIIDARAKEFLKSRDPEKIKEYRHTAYLNRKKKLTEEREKESVKN